MMSVKLLIVCEGNTDQTLIGNYIEGVTAWKYCCSVQTSPFPNENINWYSRSYSNDMVGVWDNGGNNFDRTLDKIFRREKNEHLIENLLIITDYDDDNALTERKDKVMNALLNGLGLENKIALNSNGWKLIEFENAFEKNMINVGYLLVPLDEQGALESFMLKAISDNKPENKDVINQVDAFMREFKSEVYLKKHRERIKARFGVSLAIMAPDKSTKNIKEIITSVDWGKYPIANEQMKMISDILG